MLLLNGAFLKGAFCLPFVTNYVAASTQTLLICYLNTVFCTFVCRLLELFLDGMKFNVEFTVNPLPVRVQQRAAELAPKSRMGTVLFPAAPAPSSQHTELPQLRLGTIHVAHW